MGKHTIGDSSTAPGKDWVLRATQSPKLERIEAFFHGHGYEMHRHDTYAIGRTLSGVQSFNYGKKLQHSLPGRTMVLHPDEPHDGHAGTEDGFHYRMFYVEPAHLQQVLGGKPLPFIKGGISGDPGLFAATQVLLQDMECAIDPLEMEDALFDLATALQAASGVRTARQTLDYPAAQKAREFLLASWQHTVTLSELEAVSGRDRWRLSRDFRALFGTSPYRYLTLRRLDQVRRVMTQGYSLTDAAAIAGFSDQSHMTRHFVRTYGISPGRWLKMLGAR